MYEERTVSKNTALLDAQISSKGLLFTPRHSQNRHFVALRCFKCVCKTHCSFVASARRNAHEMALPTYIHAGRFSCETENRPQECTSEL